MRKELEEFQKLFAGRTDAYGTEDGGCVRTEVTQSMYADHLLGYYPIGVYPVVECQLTVGGQGHLPGFAVKWGCSDIDSEDLQAALNLQLVFKVSAVPTYIERSKSKGYHVWVFADEWVPAATMRSAFLFAHQLVDIPPTEINPKQVHLAPDEVGNYVRLPYPGAHARGLPNKPGNIPRRVMLGNGGEAWSLGVFLERVTFAEYAKLDAMARSYSVQQKFVEDEGWEEDFEPEGFLVGPATVGPLAYKIWVNGPNDGDRSKALFALAKACREAHVAPQRALYAVMTADGRWGKFSERKDGKKRMRLLVRRAYNEG